MVVFHCQAAQRSHGASGGAPSGRAAGRPSAALRSLEREQPFLPERALHLTGQQFAEGRLMGKGQSLPQNSGSWREMRVNTLNQGVKKSLCTFSFEQKLRTIRTLYLLAANTLVGQLEPNS